MGQTNHEQIVCRKLDSPELPVAMKLAWNVYAACLAPESSTEGNETFRTYVQDPLRLEDGVCFGAFAENSMLGMIFIREDSHISLFFVEPVYQRQGIGRALMEKVMALFSDRTLTVNAAPKAVGAYTHMGFTPTSGEQLRDGIRYVPMERMERLLCKSGFVT